MRKSLSKQFDLKSIKSDRGALEMVHLEVAAWFAQDNLKVTHHSPLKLVTFDEYKMNSLNAMRYSDKNHIWSNTTTERRNISLW